MPTLRVVEKKREPLPEQEQLARLIYEVRRSALVWNNFAGALIDGWLPHRTKFMGAQFKDSDQERLGQLFKIRDIEARRIQKVCEELGIDPPQIDYGPIYDELSRDTGITATSYKKLFS